MTLLLCTGSAAAFEDVTVGGGILGVVGACFLDKPDDQTVQINGQTVDPPGVPEYPGFSGLSSGFGWFFEGRFFEYGGVELDFLRTTDSGEADLKITINGVDNKFTIEISHAAWHIPLLFKGVIPSEFVSPSLFIGPEFVLPDSDAEMNVISGEPPATPQYGAISDNYTMFTFGLGLEVNLVFIPEVDIRIPFSLRGSYNPGVENKRMERVEHTVVGGAIQRIDYKTQWKFQSVATIGAAIHF